jgi:hypothetical protein
MVPTSSSAQLLVEGKNDQHVIWALCKQHNLEETFTVETPNRQEGGIDRLLYSIPVRLKSPGLQALGIVLDADQNLEGRWQALKSRLAEAGYPNLPTMPDVEGLIIHEQAKPTLGVWLMPNNQLPGILENFVAHLIPENDALVPMVETILQDLENRQLNRYPPAKRAKAFIHTWLAWQETPGQPMGQAITAHVLSHNS